MKTYEEYMYCSPMTDGEEMRSFFNDIEVGDKVIVINEALTYGKGVVVEIMNDKAVVDFPNGIRNNIHVNELRLTM